MKASLTWVRYITLIFVLIASINYHSFIYVNFGPMPGGCDSCAADVLFDAMVKMDDYKNQINQSINAQADAAEDEKAALSADLMESVRSDAIKYITDINAKSTEIIKTKIEAGELEKCDQDKLDVYNRTK